MLGVTTEAVARESVRADAVPMLECAPGFSMSLSLAVGAKKVVASGGGGGPGATDVTAGGVQVTAGGVNVAASS